MARPRSAHPFTAAQAAAATLLALAAPTLAQTAPPPPPPAAAAPADAASAPSGAGTRVQITGGRETDTEARRRSSAARIVIGREEIDKYGDATVGEVLRRLPGVTTPGAPGRGGPPRLRGLGSGFTQILIDGQRITPGFNLDSLSPEQVERIEILRAPTAETGARAIAGTINIITREGFRVRLNDLRVAIGTEGGKPRGSVNWSHNDSSGPLTYTLGANGFAFRSVDHNRTSTTVQDRADGRLLEAREADSTTHNERFGANLNARLQWRLGEAGDSLVLMPSVFHSENASRGTGELSESLWRASTPALYRRSSSINDGQFTNARLGAMWRQRLGDVRLELNGNAAAFRARNTALRVESGGRGIDPAESRTFDDLTDVRESSATVSLKGSLLAGGGAEAAAGPAGATRATTEHALVFGGEVEAVSRDETRVSVPDVAEFGDNLGASTLRLAAYVQDEWNPTPNWAANFGLRWEGITTRGDSGQGEQPENTSSVWTPLLSAVYRPDPRSRDQLRVALTRSYRSPGTGALIARPTINRNNPVADVDQAPFRSFADSAGNPALKPELANGIDLALERYLDAGGVLSANLFHRRIRNLIRSTTELEAVSWSPTQPRWVRRPRNIGSASTTGLELEAKFRLDQLWTGAPRLELRGNAALFHSRVDGVPGPDNRLDEQARGTLNLGADYRFRGTPLSAGGNVNAVPETRTRLDDSQTRIASRKRVWDMYALWTFNPAVGLRLLANNLAPLDSTTTELTDNAVAGVDERTRRVSTGPSDVNVQLRLELKL